MIAKGADVSAQNSGCQTPSGIAHMINPELISILEAHKPKLGFGDIVVTKDLCSSGL